MKTCFFSIFFKFFNEYKIGTRLFILQISLKLFILENKFLVNEIKELI